jgi:hypothetical protein
LVSSAYRGYFEDQGINSYAVLVSNYQSGELTAENLIQAAIESGELSPMTMEDTSYIEAVDSQLNALTNTKSYKSHNTFINNHSLLSAIVLVIPILAH